MQQVHRVKGLGSAPVATGIWRPPRSLAHKKIKRYFDVHYPLSIGGQVAMELDATMLARIQFGFTAGFHYLFPPLTIGLGIMLVIFEFRWLRTRDVFWLSLTKFWVTMFAVTFAIGVATGIVLEFEFGTNWSRYSRFVGDVFGSALAAEGIFAFFLESGFLAVMVFGWKLVSPGVHFFSTVMVSLGSIFSSVWIVIANSWQQTPAGSHVVQVMRDGEPWILDGEPVMRAEIVEFWAMVFNPSSMDRLVHVWIGALILGSFFVLSICSWYLLRGRHQRFARESMKVALILGFVAALAAPFSGHSSAKVVAREQPAKLAAMEGHYTTDPDRGSPIALFGIPNDREQRLDYAVRIPGMLSFLVHGDTTTPVVGLDRFPESDRPPTFLPFTMFHLMVALGLSMILVTGLALFFNVRGTLHQKRWLLWLLVLSVLPAYAANQAGWIAAEVGRQPWTVYPRHEIVMEARQNPEVLRQYATADFSRPVDGLRTADSTSPNVTAAMVWGSMIMFVLIYGLLGMVWVFVLNTKIQKGPPVEEGDSPGAAESDEPGFFMAAGGLKRGEGSLTAAHEDEAQRDPRDDEQEARP
ncbi:MAG: cytochrome ubiquinol oxidase subunit I [Phycisphaeraceae bacterium]|nr:cytochrome ubiquinol oxidase subunit I [Phycisphaeraceae bacterium]